MYWGTKVAEAAKLLPSNDVLPQIEDLKNRVADLQHKVAVLVDSTLTTTTAEQARQLQADLRRQQGNLDEATNDLAKARDGMERALSAARTALYGLDPSGEPQLGKWQSESVGIASSSGPTFVNAPNLNFSNGKANFDRAEYITFDTSEAAIAALQRGAVNVVLDPSAASDGTAPQYAMTSPTHRIRFLAFNARSAWLRAPVRQALACMLDPHNLIGEHSGQAVPLASFVLPQESGWYNPGAVLPCDTFDPARRLTSAVEILRAAGYTWQQEPSGQSAGQGLAAPDGKELPTMQLWLPGSDPLRASAAAYAEQQGRWLGIRLTAQDVGRDAMEYGVFGSGRYDMALLGWRVSSYPGYLCDWFGAGMPFEYGSGHLSTLCGDLGSTSDLETARGQIREIESMLAHDVPMIPLYSELTYDAYRNVGYPFDRVLDGLSSVYGAPGLAFPTAP
jgi:ABC-type transport system substrate-binding protein